MRLKNWFLFFGVVSLLGVLLLEALIVARIHPSQPFTEWQQNPYLLLAMAMIMAIAFLLGLTKRFHEIVVFRFVFGIGVMLCFIALYKVAIATFGCLFQIPYMQAEIRCRYLTAFFALIAVLSAHYYQSASRLTTNQFSDL
jgi:hypothetical protein